MVLRGKVVVVYGVKIRENTRSFVRVLIIGKKQTICLKHVISQSAKDDSMLI